MIPKEEWLAGLKIGDPVRVDGKSATVAKLTPKAIILDNGTRWRREDGRQSRQNAFCDSYLEDPVDVERKRLVAKIRTAFDWTRESRGAITFTVEQLREVARILGIEA